MLCGPGTAPRAATIKPAPAAEPAEARSPAAIQVEFTVAPAGEPEWAALTSLLWGIPLALLGVCLPYWFWRKDAGAMPSATAGTHAEDPSTGGGGDLANGVVHAIKRILAPVKKLIDRIVYMAQFKRLLPGITQDWSFQDWASNVGLAGALFTAVFASGGSLEAIVGADSTSTLGVIAVAAAISTGIIGSGPLWLVIFRWRQGDDRTARDNTVAGVLVASFAVLAGTTGLLVTVAAVVDLSAARWLAAATVLVLLLYSWKSLPQTLALGAHPKDRTRMSGML